MILGFCAHSWLLYEEPDFLGQKLVLPEGDAELGASGPAWSTQGIGSLRRVVRVSRPGSGKNVALSTLGLRLLELESLGESIWSRGLKGVYYELTYRFLSLELTGECSAWLGEAGARQRPSTSLGKQLGEV